MTRTLPVTETEKCLGERFRWLMIKDVWEELQMVRFLANTPGSEITFGMRGRCGWSSVGDMSNLKRLRTQLRR